MSGPKTEGVAKPTLTDRLRLRDRPTGAAVMYQSWNQLLFAHWRVEPERIQRTLPQGLFVDVHDGTAWVGVVPFYMRNIRPRGLPCLPWISNFLELNVRTYVHDARGTPGVWFYSLDCNRGPAVWAARTLFHLPYRRARMTATTYDPAADRVDFSSTTRDGAGRFAATYHLERTPRDEPPGSLGFFLVERYLLFAADRRGRVYTGRVFHRPYPVVAARLEAWSTNLTTEHDFGIDLSPPDHLCGSHGVDVEIFGLQSTS